MATPGGTVGRYNVGVRVYAMATEWGKAWAENKYGNEWQVCAVAT